MQDAITRGDGLAHAPTHAATKSKDGCRERDGERDGEGYAWNGRNESRHDAPNDENPSCRFDTIRKKMGGRPKEMEVKIEILFSRPALL